MITRRRQSQSFCLYVLVFDRSRIITPKDTAGIRERADKKRRWRERSLPARQKARDNGKKSRSVRRPSSTSARGRLRFVPSIRPFPSMMMYNVATHSAWSVGSRYLLLHSAGREGGRRGQPSRRLSDPPQCVLNRQSEKEEQKDGHLAPPRSSARRHQRGTYSGRRTLKDMSYSRQTPPAKTKSLSRQVCAPMERSREAPQTGMYCDTDCG